MSKLRPDDLAKAEALPSRTLNQEAYHQGPPDTDPLERPPPGRFAGRYHTKKDRPPLYCSTGTEMVAMMEQVRHTSLGELSSEPLPVRLLATVRLNDLRVVDYANDMALDICDLVRAQLLEDDWTLSQQLGALARKRGDVQGLLAPSAGHPAATTVVVFPEAISDHIEVLATRAVQLQLVEAPTGS
jgi:RES domain-containing protein